MSNPKLNITGQNSLCSTQAGEQVMEALTARSERAPLTIYHCCSRPLSLTSTSASVLSFFITWKARWMAGPRSEGFSTGPSAYAP